MYLLFLAVLGLHCCVSGLSLVVVCGLLIVVASLVEYRLRCAGFRSCSSPALEHRLSSCGAQA